MGIDTYVEKKKEAEARLEELNKNLESKKKDLEKAINAFNGSIVEQSDLEVYIAIQEQKTTALDNSIRKLDTELDQMKQKYNNLESSQQVMKKREFWGKIGAEVKQMLVGEESQYERILRSVKETAEKAENEAVRDRVSQRTQMIQEVAENESRELARNIAAKMDIVKLELIEVVISIRHTSLILFLEYPTIRFIIHERLCDVDIWRQSSLSYFLKQQTWTKFRYWRIKGNNKSRK